MKLFDKTLTTLEKSLDVRLLRQNVLSGNLANANTPAYQPREVDFSTAMAAARKETFGLTQTRDTHIPVVQSPQESLADAPGVIFQETGAAPGIDGNSVDLDRTMVDLAQNAMQYGAATRAAGKKLAILRYVASDGVG